jgi:hypothetical protein
LELVLGTDYVAAKDGLPPGLRNRLLRVAAFQNPEFYKARTMRLPTYEKPRIIACAEEYPQHIGLPRGCMEDVQLLTDLNITQPCVTSVLMASLERRVSGNASAEQKTAADSMLKHETESWLRRRVREDSCRCVVDRTARRQHTCAGASTAVARSVGGAAVDVSEHQQP